MYYIITVFLSECTSSIDVPNRCNIFLIQLRLKYVIQNLYQELQSRTKRHKLLNHSKLKKHHPIIEFVTGWKDELDHQSEYQK